MTRFRYQAVGADGVAVKGEVESISEAAARSFVAATIEKLPLSPKLTSALPDAVTRLMTP